MREIWVNVDPSLSIEEKRDFIRKTSKFSTVFLVDSRDEEIAKNAGAKIIASSSETADITIVRNLNELVENRKRGKKTCFFTTVKSKRDEKIISSASEGSADYVVVRFVDWKVIPLENLIASIHGKSKLIVNVSNLQEAQLILETLEIGADGILVYNKEPERIMDLYETVKRTRTRKTEIEASEIMNLAVAQVTEIKSLGSGARVCIDTCDLMKTGEGILVGCQSSALFLVEAEVYETPFVNPRPFRVNAGSVALYVLAPQGKTKYLSELKSGDEVLIVDRKGKSRTTNICRVKIEWRPMLLIEAEIEGKTVKTILQNAETIRLVTENGTKTVKDLSTDDRVIIYLQEGGRHFGTVVKEEKVIEL